MMSLSLWGWSIINMFAFAFEYCTVLVLFSALERRISFNLRALGAVCLAGLASIYWPAEAAVLLPYSVCNLLIQLGRMLLHLSAVLGYVFFSYELAFPKALYLAGFYTVGYLAAQNFRFVFLLVGITVSGQSVYKQLSVLAACVAEGAIAWYIKRYALGAKGTEVGAMRWIFLGMSLVLEVYFKWSLIANVVNSTPENRNDLPLFAFFSSFGIFTVLALLESNLCAEASKQRAELERLSLGYEMQNAKRALQTNNDIRRLYHDMKNHLLAIQSIAGSESEVCDYLNGLLPQFEGYESQVTTGNTIVDALLSEKIQRAALDNIRFNIRVELSALGFMKSVDLVTIFGNAVDNAIEAVQMLPDAEARYIYIKSDRYANTVMLRFENPYIGRINHGIHGIATTKHEKTMHGIGLNSISTAVQRYNGSMDVKYENTNNWFILAIILPERTDLA